VPVETNGPGNSPELNPAPISIHIVDATLDQVAAELSKQTGLQIVPHKEMQGDGGGVFTLDTTNAQFLDVYAALSRQHALPIQLKGERRTLLNVPPLWQYDRHGGFLAFASSAIRRVDAQRNPSNESALSRVFLTYGIALDPRIRVLEASAPRINSVKDAAGDEHLARQEHPPTELKVVNGQDVWSGTIEVGGLKHDDVVVVRGESTFVVQSAEECAALDDITQYINKPFVVGGHQIVLTRITNNDDKIGLNILSKPLISNAFRRIQYTLEDSRGAKIWEYASPGGGVGANILVQNAGPFKLTARVPKKTLQFRMDFCLKDIVIP
jgi:hypothetical protein